MNLDLFAFLLQHAEPEYRAVASSATNDALRDDRLRCLLLLVSGTTRYRVPLPAVEKFLGEQVSFEKHLRPLMGMIHFCGTDGRIMDYKTREQWIAFRVGGNEFLEHYGALISEATRLGLFDGVRGDDA